MRVSRAQDYAYRLMPGASIPALHALAEELSRRPELVRIITSHINREQKRQAARQRELQPRT